MKMFLRRLTGKKGQVSNKFSATQLSRMRAHTPAEIKLKLIERGYIVTESGCYIFTDLGRKAGGEIRKNHPEAREGHMIWPANIALHENIIILRLLAWLLVVFGS
jgi:hypothetical protein